MSVERVVVVVPTDRIYTEFIEESDKEIQFVEFEVVFLLGTTPSIFTDKECSLVRVTHGMILLEPYLEDLRQRGTEVVIVG